MNIAAKKLFASSVLIITGILVGAVSMNLLDMYVRPIYRDVIRVNLMTEQEYLAARAAREHNFIRVVTHRWNVVDATAKDGFRVFVKENTRKEDNNFFLPFALLGLKFIARHEEAQKGVEIDEGIKRGKLAVAMETMGNNEEAARQWKLAKSLTGIEDIARVKRLIFGLIEQENSKIHLDAEKSVLGNKQ